MNENRLPDYIDHRQQAGADACAFVEDLGKDDFGDVSRKPPKFPSSPYGLYPCRLKK